jgi:hypothetical protein
MLLSAIMAGLTVQGPERGRSDLNGKNTDGYICSVWYVHQKTIRETRDERRDTTRRRSLSGSNGRYVHGVYGNSTGKCYYNSGCILPGWARGSGHLDIEGVGPRSAPAGRGAEPSTSDAQHTLDIDGDAPVHGAATCGPVTMIMML